MRKSKLEFERNLVLFPQKNLKQKIRTTYMFWTTFIDSLKDDLLSIVLVAFLRIEIDNALVFLRTVKSISMTIKR